ncbi:N-acetylglucosaminyl-phosphatidylinositol de-N-acetylase [Coemansia spiralis]|nr:N-acetylglucosaminyl-phosphatidylinositol de-N-acetylase [Coemansia spiralis]
MILAPVLIPVLLASALAYLALCLRPQLVERAVVPAAKRAKAQKHVLFVTAHPDDECMFFTPTLATLARRSDTAVSLLCLSKGNHDGLGDVRKKELVKAAVSFGLSPDSVIIVDDPNLPDDPHRAWNVALVARTVEAVVVAGDVDAVFTFDRQGVSGHQNHIAAYMGVKHMAQTAQWIKLHPVNVYALESVGLARKYMSIVDTVFSLGALLAGKDSLLFVSDVAAYSMGVRAMAMHESQLVWFRKLYLAFSRYMFLNTYSKIN